MKFPTLFLVVITLFSCKEGVICGDKDMLEELFDFLKPPLTFWKVSDAIVKIGTNDPYKLTEQDKETAKACFVTYNLRIWNRLSSKVNPLSIPLTKQETLCNRVATFGPNDKASLLKRQGSKDRFMHLTLEYFKWTLPYYSIIRPSPDEKQQMENCYFASRTWQHKLDSMLSSNEAFCKRLASYKPPNATELERIAKAGSLDPLFPFHEVWENMTLAFKQDYDQIHKCFPMDSKPKLIETSQTCAQYYKLVKSPNTWRDIRRREYHKCMGAQKMSVVQANKCLDLTNRYKRMYYSGKVLSV